MRDVDLVAAYHATRWTVDADAGPLEVRPGARVPAGAFPLPAAVLTAYNPRSEPRSAEENRSANERLVAELRRLGVEARPALAHGTGPQPDRWNEPGFLVTALPLGRVLDLAARFRQNAVLWIDEGGLPTIVSARAGFAGSTPGTLL